jgi:hypothetical protein
MRFLFALVLAASSALAGDAVDDALGDLGADDPAVRDAAEKFLWRAGGSAYHQAKSALDATKDAEVRVRLTPIVEWLLVEVKSAPLEAIWADRWFVLKQGGQVTGVEHIQATLGDVAGLPVWTFVEEGESADRGEAPQHVRLAFRVRHDPFLSVVDGDFQVGEAEELLHLRYDWKDGEVEVHVLATPGRGDGEFPRRRGSKVALKSDGPFTPDFFILERVERASLARLPEIRFQCARMLLVERAVKAEYVVRFAGVESIDHAGQQVAARHYVHEAEEDWGRADFWVTDRDGLVRGTMEGADIERVDKETALAAGLDPAARRMEASRARVAAMLAGRDAEKKTSAELEILARPQDRPAVLEALQANPAAEDRERLERIARWLDPEFGRPELAAIWKDRYFEVEKEGRGIGTERKSAAISAGQAGLDWSGEDAWDFGDGAEAILWTSHTRFDSFLTPVRAGRRGTGFLRDTGEWSCEFSDGLVSLVAIRGRSSSLPELTRESTAYFPPRESPAPLSLENSISCLVERASLARLPVMVFERFEFEHQVDSHCSSYRIELAGEETMSWQGKEVPVRHYVHPNGSRQGRVDYWVSDAHGLLRRTFSNFDVKRIGREAWLASGFTEAAVRASLLRSRLKALQGTEPAARDDAMAELQSHPEDLAELRTALAAEADPATRKRLQSICDWLDPAFGKEAMASLGGERWLAWKSGNVHAGWERRVTTAGASGFTWTTESDLPIAGGMANVRRAICRAGTNAVADTYEVEMASSGIGTDYSIKVRIRSGSMEIVEMVSEGVRLDIESERLQPLRGGDGRPAVPTFLKAHLLERASLARLEILDFAEWTLTTDGEIHTQRLAFKGEEQVSVAGKDVLARHYVGNPEPNGDPIEYWLTDDAGVVKVKANGLEGEASTEKDAKSKAGK